MSTEYVETRRIEKSFFESPAFRTIEFFQGCGGKVDVPPVGDGEFDLTDLQKLEQTGSYFAESKCDGIWAAMFIGEDKNEFYSKTMKRKAYPDLEGFILPELAGTVLIGELGYGSQTAVERRKKLGHGFADVFDVAFYKYRDVRGCDLRQRQVYLANVFLSMSRNGVDVRHFQAIAQYYEGFLGFFDEEKEGLILKRRDGGPYLGCGHREKNWLKVKKQPTLDLVIMEFELSDADSKVDEDMAKSVICGQFFPVTEQEYEERKTLEILGKDTFVTYFAHNGENGTEYYVLRPTVKIGNMTNEWSRTFAQDFDEYRGRVMEVSHFQQFKSGSLRHPSMVRIRDDKESIDCLFRVDEV